MSALAPSSNFDDPRFAISIGGKIYGPYSAQQMRSFIGEGRVTASSLVSREGGAWTAASDDEFCARIFAQRARRVDEAPPLHEGAEAAKPAAKVAAASSAREAFLKELEGVRGLKPSEPAAHRQGPPRADAPAAGPLFPTEREAHAESSNFIIVFDLKSRGHTKLEEQIMALGRAVRVQAGVWLLNAHMTSGAIRNSLTKFFGSGDTFFIVDATRDKIAWFNLGPEADAQIRQVWRRT